MRLLLDTHALIWALYDASALSAAAREAIIEADADIFVSVISAFEVATKYAIGKLPGVRDLAIDFEREIAQLDCTLLVMTATHAVRAGSLPLRHRDPFDRLLIAQADIEGLTLVSNERLFDQYGVRRLW